MRLGNYTAPPCGCEARKEIMFTVGKPGIAEAAILTVAVLSLLIALKVGRNEQ